MRPLDLLKTLAAGFLPLLAYILVEALFGETAGLVAGLVFGLGEFLYILVREKKADPFVAADTILLAVLGGLSLAFHSGGLFRMKPAIMEAFMAAAMGVLLALPPPAFKAYLARQLKGLAPADAAMPEMRRSLGLMTGVLAAHAGLTAWAALTASAAVWGFVSGGLLYLMLGLAIAWQWLKARATRRKAGTAGISNGAGIAPGGTSSSVYRAPWAAGTETGVVPREGAGPGDALWSLVVSTAPGTLYLSRNPPFGYGGSPDADPGRSPAVGPAGTWDLAARWHGPDMPPAGAAPASGGTPEPGADRPPGAVSEAGAAPASGTSPATGADASSGAGAAQRIAAGRIAEALQALGIVPAPGDPPFEVKVLCRIEPPVDRGAPPVVVALASVPPGSMPRGRDSLRERAWSLGDLAAVRGTGILSPRLEHDLAPLFLALADSRAARGPRDATLA